MAYESMKKPASTVVPVQKKATVSAPPGMMGQQQETSVPSGQEQTLSNKPATDDDWLMKSGLFTGQHLLQRLSSPVSESSERESAGSGQVEQREDETVQAKETAMPHSLPLQAKLTIGEPNDVYEQEADRVARQVVDKINSPAPETVQRMEMQEGEEVQRKSDVGEGVTGVRNTPIQGMRVKRKAMSVGQTSEASAELEASIQGKRGSGQPLDESVREPMEGAFGADFSGVRVHTDGKSDELNQSIQAKAFTTGEDIFFREGAYEPGSKGGQELLAHELTHVVQKSGIKKTKSHKKKSSKANKVIKPKQYQWVKKRQGAPGGYAKKNIKAGNQSAYDPKTFKNAKAYEKAKGKQKKGQVTLNACHRLSDKGIRILTDSILDPKAIKKADALKLQKEMKAAVWNDKLQTPKQNAAVSKMFKTVETVIQSQKPPTQSQENQINAGVKVLCNDSVKNLYPGDARHNQKRGEKPDFRYVEDQKKMTRTLTPDSYEMAKLLQSVNKKLNVAPGNSLDWDDPNNVPKGYTSSANPI